MIVMTKILRLLLLSLIVMTCGTDYSIVETQDIQIIQTESEPPPETKVVVDYFVQPKKPDNLDVLVILDTSCSMSDNYENVAAGLDILRGDIELLTYDYQMALINSSLREPYFAGIFDSDTPSMDFYIAPYSLGTDFSEEPFTSLYRFSTTEEGELFLRNGVAKLYIFVSDEPEQSSMPVSLFYEWMAEYHEDVLHDVVIVGINDYSSCDNYYNYDNDDDRRYEEFATYYNKTIIDICGDFQLAMANNSFIVNPITHMRLSEVPIEESIVVYQDGDIETDWYFLPATNTVYFEFEIDGGGVIKIGYDSYL